ncbi:hypothetical protein CE195_02375, partial [Sodalis-like symbiont of Philaenus spumarius]
AIPLVRALRHRYPLLPITVTTMTPTIDTGYMVEYLPIFSPILHPIEHKWAQAKSKKRESDYDKEILFSVHMV